MFVTFLIISAKENGNQEVIPFVMILSGIGFLIVNSRLVMSQFLVFDKNKSPVSSIKESKELTKGKTFKVIGWLMMISIINGIGGATIIGAVISFPLSICLLTKVYYDLNDISPPNNFEGKMLDRTLQ